MNNREKFLTRLEVVKKSHTFLEAKGVPNAKCDSEWIISSSLGVKRMELYLLPNEIVEEGKVAEIRNMIVKRGKREPLQHIFGNVQFAGISLKCDNRALIPRPETEFLVEHILRRVAPSLNGKILDLGTGSGAILLALCSALPEALGVGLDNCPKALSLARDNTETLELEGRVRLQQWDWRLDTIKDKEFNLVVSNPPYLKQEEWESAEPEVREYDPKNALLSEDDGFYDLRKVIDASKEMLLPGGTLALEFGVAHAENIEESLGSEFSEIEILKDLSHYRRFALATKK